jgi:hypothetical protein
VAQGFRAALDELSKHGESLRMLRMGERGVGFGAPAE